MSKADGPTDGGRGGRGRREAGALPVFPSNNGRERQESSRSHSLVYFHLLFQSFIPPLLMPLPFTPLSLSWSWRRRREVGGVERSGIAILQEQTEELRERRERR